MKSEIKLMNKYCAWKEIKFNEVMYYLKGNVFFNNKLLSPEKLTELMTPLICREDESQEKELGEFFEGLNGEFAIVAETNSRIFCAVDKLRRIPLFYITTKDNFVISDDAYYLKDKINSRLNEKNAAEFMVAGYVTGDETLFDGIKQIRSGEFLTYQKKDNFLKTSCYFRFSHGNYYELPESQLLEMLDQVFVHTFSRLIESTVNQGKKLIVPLSGGLDSRIIVAMLKRLGVNDVTCVSYGRKSNRESIISKQVAEALGYDWLFVEYTAQKWHECYNSKEADCYRTFAGNLSSLPHMQDFLTVKTLKSQGKIPDNSVFVPGHTADMLAGSHIPSYYLDNSTKYDSDTFSVDSLKLHYNLWKWPYELENTFKEKLNKSISGLEINDNKTCASAIELFDFNERQSKFIVNSVRAYEFFGYDWRTPFWDMELIEFYLKVSLEYRINQTLYIKYARDRLFSGELNVLKKIDCTTDILDLRPLEERSKYEKILYYWTFIHSYYDEKINNPIWGRYFENPIISRLLTKATRYDNKAIEEYPLLKMILEYRNEKNYPLSINGISSLEYLASIKGETYSSAGKAVLQPTVSLTKRLIQVINMKAGNIHERR
ncbi:MAG: asparagine synthase C-terminal domain-containing protein [Methanosarcina sp.]